ncbi:MAG: CoA transferase [Anaerolineae bacterium]
MAVRIALSRGSRRRYSSGNAKAAAVSWRRRCLRALLLFASYVWSDALALGSGAGESALTGGLACYNVYQARDGRYVSLGALEPKFWSNFCATVDRPDLIPDYVLPERQRYLKAEVAEIFARRTAQEWQELLYDAECCFALVAAPDALANDAQVKARDMAGVDENGAWMRTPLRVGDERVERGTVPGYGADTRAVLLEAGYSDAEIDALVHEGKVR